MADGLIYILGLSAVIAISSFVAGTLPLLFNLSPRAMRLMTICGTGVLVGTSIIVVIPEGVETLYSVRPAETHAKRSIAITEAGFRAATGLSSLAGPGSILVRRNHADTLQERGNDPGALSRAEQDLKLPFVETDPYLPKVDRPMSPPPGHDDFEPHAWIGISVIAGFILMYIIDTIPKIARTTNRRPSYIFLERLGLSDPSTTSLSQTSLHPNMDTDDEGHDSSASNGVRQSGAKSPLTTGLVIHAAADGIALGASTTASSTTADPNSRSLAFIIFLALMIHKAPAAFGLVAVLLKRGVSKRRIRTHLLVFSLAAPVGALVAWIAATFIGSIVGGPAGHGDGTGFATGVLLLFSGGTFLYVAMHAMQDASHDMDDTPDQDPYGAPATRQVASQSVIDMLAMLGGMLLPILTQMGHH